MSIAVKKSKIYSLNSISIKIKEKAKSLGFYDCGIAKADFLEEEAVRLEKWLEEGRHAAMEYMGNYFDKRTDPRKLLENARSVIVVLFNYYPEKTIPDENNYKISKYAYGTDYHFVMKDKLKDMISFINEIAGNVNARAFVDSAPVLERSWAEKAGLGWIGKNTCLITKEQGSFFFIGEIITDLELTYDLKTVLDYCGGCTRCIQACPTDALGKYGLDANRCISYWTIEHRGDEIDQELKGKFNDWIFGCDICQDVCPWNRLSEEHHEEAFKPLEILKKSSKPEWEKLTRAEFNKEFRKSPIKRTRFEGLKRNIEFLKIVRNDEDFNHLSNC